METNAWVVQTVRKMDRDPRIAEVVSLTYCDTPIPMLRNRAVLDARKAECRYLLMIDSDMAPDLPYPGARPFWDAAWEFLMERNREEWSFRECEYALGEGGPGNTFAEMNAKAFAEFPPATVAAPYCGPPPDECVFIFEWQSYESDTPNPNFRLSMVPRESAAIRTGIAEAAALPTGLILYDMRVFDVLPPPWFRYEHDPLEAEKHTTEDVYQTRNASLLHLPQYAAWDSWAGHVKTKVVGKPLLVTRDQVHASLRQAVLRGVDSGDRLLIMKGNVT
jgi:hypothetical protein